MGMGGVQRSSKFVKYLPDFGWEVTALTSATGAYYAFDYTLLEELQKEHIQIVRTGSSGKAKEVKNLNEKLRKFLGKSAQTILLPDTKRLWKNKAKKFADEIIAEYKPDVIFATAPPYTDFMLGFELSVKYDIPLVIDYRDAWVDCPYNFYLTPFHKMINMNYEKKILEHAKKVITINQ
ncbi:MAG TPA: glycosyl transferase family 1, partial [Ignavibacteria bacterium]|nr:glycosyl transferase family 1 [Ignavibacteria bacterium]